MLFLGALVGAAALARLVARALHAPPAALYVAVGFGLRAVLPPARPFLDDLLLLSLAFVLFSAGANLHPARFRRGTVPRLLAFGVGGAGLVGLAAAALASASGWGPQAAAYAAAAVGLSSTVLVMQTLALRGEVPEAHGRLLAGGLIAQDALALLLLAALPALAVSAVEPVVQVGRVLALAGVALLVAWAGRRPALWRIAPEAEVRVLLAAALVFGSMLLAGFVGVPAAAGAFLAGLAVAPWPANVHLRPAVRSAREFFTPIFFVALGIFFPLPSRAEVPLVLGLLALVVVAKPVVLAVVARAGGLTRRASAEAGALAGQASEFALLLVLAGAAVGALDAGRAALLGTVVALSLVLMPFLARPTASVLAALLPPDPPPPGVPRSGHVVLLGAGRSASVLAERLRARGDEIVAVDADPHALAHLPHRTPTIGGDATDPRVLEAAHVGAARAVVVLLRDDVTTLAAVEAVRDRAPEARLVVRVGSDAAEARAHELGAGTVRASALVAAELRRTLDRIEGRSPG